MKYPLWFVTFRVALFTSCVVALHGLNAETGRPGFALVKPQAWSPEDQVTIMEFLSFEDRSVKTSPGAGYFDFRTAKRPSVQVPAARLVKVVVYPDAPVTLMTKAQRAELQAVIDDFEAIGRKVGGASRMLKPSLTLLQADAAKYDAGNLKEDGVWVAKSAYYKKKAIVVMDLLRADLVAGAGKPDFDLESNQYFLGLQDLAAEDSGLAPMVESVRAQNDAAKRRAARTAVLAKLKASGVTYEDSVALVAELKTMKPEEDATVALFLKGWDTSVVAAEGVRGKIEETKVAFEAAMVPAAVEGEVPTVSDAVAEQVRVTAAVVEQFMAGNPAGAIKVPSDVSDAMAACVARLPSVKTQVRAKQYLEAKAILDPLVEAAPKVGPNTTAVLGVLQRAVTTQIDRFRALRDEAKMLADSDKIEAAIKKYEEAFATIPEKEIAAQIEALKKQ